MKTRAAVAFEAKQPLEIVELDLDGPRAGEEIDPMITHLLTLDEINKGFEPMHSGTSIRSVVVY